MANIQHIFSGAGAPSTIPTGIGHHYIDTTSGATYVSTGTTAISDWKFVPGVIVGTGAPSTTPSNVGDTYIDNTSGAEEVYHAVHTTDATGWKIAGSGSGGGLVETTTTFDVLTHVCSLAADADVYHITYDGLTHGGTAISIELPSAAAPAKTNFIINFIAPDGATAPSSFSFTSAAADTGIGGATPNTSNAHQVFHAYRGLNTVINSYEWLISAEASSGSMGLAA